MAKQHVRNKSNYTKATTSEKKRQPVCLAYKTKNKHQIKKKQKQKKGMRTKNAGSKMNELVCRVIMA